MALSIPTLEDFNRLEAKVDQMIKLLNERPKKVDSITDMVDRRLVMEELNFSVDTARRLEKQKIFNRVKRGNKVYWPKSEVKAYMEKKSYKKEILTTLKIA